MSQSVETLMNSPISEKVSEETPSALDSALIAEKETNAQRLLSFIARLTSNSTDELDKAIAELERLQEFLESEPGRGGPIAPSRCSQRSIAPRLSCAVWPLISVPVRPRNRRRQAAGRRR